MTVALTSQERDFQPRLGLMHAFDVTVSGWPGNLTGVKLWVSFTG